MGIPTLSRMRVGAAPVPPRKPSTAMTSARDRRDVMDRRDLYDDGLFIFGRFLDRIYELAQILDGIDIVMRRGRDGVRTLRDHARFGNVRRNFRTRQMSADPGFRALPHLDFDGGCVFQIIFEYAESAARHLHDGIFPVFVEILVQSALARIVIDTQRLRRTRERLVRIVRNGTVTHRRKQDGHL